ncbi:MAG: pantoate--beta-alanine ligase [Bergeyella zoohelcum]|nr:pantoate--beta-alanine ligase [Bergeyella zoohelcum]
MKILSNKKELEIYIKESKSHNKKIGFAPTMGALHAGHISLYKLARKDNDVVISSIFVNPTQFNNAQDLEKYPRTIEADIQKLTESQLVDAVYIPSVEDVYPNGLKSQSYDFDGLENEMEGKFRPGHFEGVGTIVEELFAQVQPDNAYFGEKDFQQLAIIRKMVEKKNIPTKIHGAEILREPHGLAMSSRNERLNNTDREHAKIIYETLLKVKNWFGEKSIPEIKQEVENIFKTAENFELEYFIIADEQTLKETDLPIENHKYRAFIAVFVGEVRLIDNIGL